MAAKKKPVQSGSARNKSVPRLTEVSVTGLFGQYDHTISLNSDGITLIHGPNGVGKTAVLELIRLALSLSLEELAVYVFDELSLTFNNGDRLTITCKPVDRDTFNKALSAAIHELNDLDFLDIARLSESELRDYCGTADTEWFQECRLEFAKENVEFIDTMEVNFCDSEKGDTSQLDILIPLRRDPDFTLSTEILAGRIRGNVSSHMSREVDGRRRRKISTHMSPEEENRLTKIRKRLPALVIDSIESQRLVRTSGNLVDERNREAHGGPRRSETLSTEATILSNANKMKSLIKDTAVETASLNAELDRTWQHRIRESKVPDGTTDLELITDLWGVQEAWDHLREMGILAEGEQENFTVPTDPAMDKIRDEFERRITYFHIKDQDLKLEVYQDLRDKVSLFLEAVNARFEPSNKGLVCDVKEGFSVVTFDLNRGIGAPRQPCLLGSTCDWSKVVSVGKVPLERLSSGEQHLIVMYFRLIFEIPAGSLVLIDEPEISLHVEWQRQFVRVLQRVAESTNHSFLVATHSPQIVDDFWDHTQQLGQPVDDLADGEDE